MMVGREVLLRVEKTARDAGRAAARGGRPPRARRPRARGRSRRLVRGAERRDRRHRRRRRERPDRADRGDHRPAPGRGRRDHGRRQGRDARIARTTILDAGVGHIPEDRQRRGLVLEFTLAENIALHDYDQPPDSRFGWLFRQRIVERARGLLKEFDVRGGGPQTRAAALSGGNQQKVVLAREVSRDPQRADRRAADARPRRRRDRVRPPAASSRSATRARRSCSSRSSSTRSSRSPTGSSSSTRAGSSASTRPTSPRRSSASR